jgi:hypothetical protein
MSPVELSAFAAAGAERLDLHLSPESRRAVEANLAIIFDLAAQVEAALPADGEPVGAFRL